MAGNVATSTVSQNTKSDPDSFMRILEDSIDIVRKNWNIEIIPTISELFNIDSSNIQPEHWTMMAEEIQNKYDDHDAFIILHGTNTMGYSASALTFALENINKPVIFTGAQVPLGYLGTDSVTNLVNSLRMAVWGYHEIK